MQILPICQLPKAQQSELQALLHPAGVSAKLVTAVAFSVVFTYLVTYLRYRYATSSNQQAVKEPPILPYWIPFVGHLVSWLGDSHALLTKSLEKVGHSIPFGLKLGPLRFYFLGDPKLADALMYHIPGVKDTDSICFALQYIFAARPEVVNSMYRADDSGPGPKPYPESKTPPERRARYLQSKSARDFLSGQAGVELGLSYQHTLLRNMEQNTDLKNGEWVSYTDLWDFVYDLAFPANTETIFGKRILEMNPSLCPEIKGFLADLPVHIRMWPRLLAPASYRRRDIALDSIKKWLREVYDHSASNASWNVDHGCDYVKERHRFLSHFEEMNIENEASETLGLFMAVMPNSIGAMYWTIFEVFSRPELVDRIRKLCEPAVNSEKGEVDSVRLCRTPLLQSVAAEALRMRVQGMIVRSASRPVEIEGWKFPKDAYLAVPSNFGGLNEKVWNLGTTESPRPLDSFWADRFLICPNDPSSGPVRSDNSPFVQNSQEDVTSSNPIYSERGLKGAYFPFGGRLHPCPGRQFSQHAVLSTLAILALNYEIEVNVESGWAPKMKTNHFGFGVLPPAEKVPFRIRRKH